MGRKANPAMIGAFVVGAVILAVAGILIFGSGQLFKHTSQYVCFFPGAVNGLNVGAPVKIKAARRPRFSAGKGLKEAVNK